MRFLSGENDSLFDINVFQLIANSWQIAKLYNVRCQHNVPIVFMSNISMFDRTKWNTLFFIFIAWALILVLLFLCCSTVDKITFNHSHEKGVFPLFVLVQCLPELLSYLNWNGKWNDDRIWEENAVTRLVLMHFWF